MNSRVPEEKTAGVSEHTAQRIAHARRGHLRLLRHPRYTHKRGQMVRVRAAWIGPKEWKDFNGSTYVIVEPTGSKGQMVASN
jgi:hypothetical protein